MTAVSLSGNAAVQTLGLIFRTWTSQKCRELQVQEKERQTNAQYHTDRNAGIRKNYAGKTLAEGLSYHLSTQTMSSSRPTDSR